MPSNSLKYLTISASSCRISITGIPVPVSHPPIVSLECPIRPTSHSSLPSSLSYSHQQHPPQSCMTLTNQWHHCPHSLNRISTVWPIDLQLIRNCDQQCHWHHTSEWNLVYSMWTPHASSMCWNCLELWFQTCHPMPINPRNTGISQSIYDLSKWQ